MLQALNKLIAIIIALVVLFTSFSFTVEKHVCMGEVTNTSYFSDADYCEMAVDECDTNDLDGSNIQNEGCCSNVQDLIPGNQNVQQALDKLEVNDIQFILAFTYTYQNLFNEKENISPFVNYSPPILVDKDICVLYQTFLI